MKTNYYDLATAMAGMFQAAYLVDQLATNGKTETHPSEVMVRSLLAQNPSTTLDVYSGQGHNLRQGLRTMVNCLENPRSQTLHYVLAMCHLQKLLRQQPQRLGQIAERLPQIESQLLHFGPLHDNTLGNIAQLYQDTLSSFRFRIQVRGQQHLLEQSRIANQIRALLLSGVRSALLWQQLGGRGWTLMLRRKKLLKTAQAMLTQLEPQY